MTNRHSEKSDHLGEIRFFRGSFGRIEVGQQWNPSLLDQFERAKIAESLREIASAIDRDEFNECVKTN